MIYPDYVVLWMPQQADPTRVDTFYYDGSFDPPSPAGTRDPVAEPVFDLAELDADAMACLILQAPAAVEDRRADLDVRGHRPRVRQRWRSLVGLRV